MDEFNSLDNNRTSSDKIYLTKQDLQTILRAVANERDFVKSKWKETGDPLLNDKRLRLNQVHFKLREFKRINGI